MEDLTKESEVFVAKSNEYGQAIKPVEVPSKDIGIDMDNQFLYNVAQAGLSGKLDMATIESFTNISRTRDNLYDLLDMMMEDSTMASVLETYAEDTTEYNDQGRIVWAESNDSLTLKRINYILDLLNVDKHIYAWVHCLIKYGDVYLKLFRDTDESELEYNVAVERSLLNEGVVAKAHNNADKYTGYVEMIKNPAEVFELTKLGKTRGYIKTDIHNLVDKTSEQIMWGSYYQSYKFNSNDVELYAADDFVHGFLEDNNSRIEEKINIFYDTDPNTLESKSYTFSVNRGQSLFYTAFKAWRELSLIQNAILLNRVTKSAIVRAIQVEVGDMPKDMIANHLQGIKQMIEQKAAINAARSISEYTNPGPIENNIYVPTHGGVGRLTIQSVGGEVDMGQLTDLDSFENKLFGALRVPKQYFGLTDDAAGFNGGTSLSLISSRYAKTIKRIQNAVIQMITDLVNLMLIDRGFDDDVNNFTIKMQAPTTQEEIDRRDNMASKINMATDIMNMLDDIDDPIKRLEILKSLLASVLTDQDVLTVIQDQIDQLTAELEETGEQPVEDEDSLDLDFDQAAEDDVFGGLEPAGSEDLPTPEEAGIPAPEEGPAEEDFGELDADKLLNEQSEDLPTPEQLGVDLTI